MVRTSNGRSLRCSRALQGQHCPEPAAGPTERVVTHLGSAALLALEADRLAGDGSLWRAAAERLDPAPARTAVPDDSATLARLEDLLADGLLSPDAYRRQRARVEARRAVPAERAGKDTNQARKPLYEALRGLEARVLVPLVIERAELLPAPRMGAPFDPHSRVRITWR